MEPALVREWLRLMQGYAAGQGRGLDLAAAEAAMAWEDPRRRTELARQQAERVLAEDRPLHCVWSGRRLDRRTLDIDHCLPFSAWPCGDLWNLLPAHWQVNQHEKRERLPSDAALRRAGAAILDWWRDAYQGTGLAERFAAEARASLPGLPPGGAGEDVLAALALQRLRLRRDQQVPEWRGAA